MAIKLRTLSSKIRKPSSPRLLAASDFFRRQQKNNSEVSGDNIAGQFVWRSQFAWG